jgi:hypothetical protein
MKLFSTLYKVQAGVNKLIMQQKNIQIAASYVANAQFGTK